MRLNTAVHGSSDHGPPVLSPTTDPSAHRSGPAPRSARVATALLVPLQLFLAAGWARAGVEKVIDARWWTGAYLRDFLDEQRPVMLPWFRPFADAVVDPLAPVIAWLVVAVQLAIAVCLFSNRYVKPALWCAIVLNVAFTMAGRVNPSAFYLVMQLALLFALSRPVTTKIATRRAVLWLVPAVIVLPFARTVDPAHVIDDPALMLSFVAVLAAITTIALSVEVAELTSLARERLHRAAAHARTRVARSPDQATTDARRRFIGDEDRR